MPDIANPQRVSVVGLGSMGMALAQAFLAHKHRVTVWNRTPRKCAVLRSAGAGANVAESVASAAAADDVVVVCVLDYQVSDSLIHTPEVASRLKGKVLLQLSTGTPKDARGGEAWARANDVRYLDGAIMGYPKDIGTTAGTVLYSGPQEVYDACSALLLSLGGNPTFVGPDIGGGSTLDAGTASAGIYQVNGGFWPALISAAPATPTVTVTGTRLPTQTPIATQTATVTRSPSLVPILSPTVTATMGGTLLPTRTATVTATVTITASATVTTTPATPTQTGLLTATPTPSATPTPTTTGGASCTGDCDHRNNVSVDELVTGVNIALGNQLVEVCVTFDPDNNSHVTVDELVQ